MAQEGQALIIVRTVAAGSGTAAHPLRLRIWIRHSSASAAGSITESGTAASRPAFAPRRSPTWRQVFVPLPRNFRHSGQVREHPSPSHQPRSHTQFLPHVPGLITFPRLPHFSCSRLRRSCGHAALGPRAGRHGQYPRLGGSRLKQVLRASSSPHAARHPAAIPPAIPRIRPRLAARL